MPPRLVTLAIITFWLAVAGLFVATDVWPRLAPSEPLMFPIDVVDEAGQQKEQVNYNVSKNGTVDYRAEVELRYHPEDDSFESECKLEPRWHDREEPRKEGQDLLLQFHRVRMKNTYRLTRGGEMKRLDSSTQYRCAEADDQQGGMIFKAEVSGTPQAGRFAPQVRLSFLTRDDDGPATAEQIGPFKARDFERDASPVPVLPRGIVLNPLHPPRRFTDLAENQRWRVTFIDPLAVLGLLAPLDASQGGVLSKAGLDAGAAAWVLDAQVLPGTQMIDWDAEKKVACHVIRCDGDGPIGPVTFWVRQRDGVVMREDFRLWGDEWSLVRLSQNYKMRPYQAQQKAP
jgi:hypothetical protein